MTAPVMRVKGLMAILANCDPETIVVVREGEHWDPANVTLLQRGYADGDEIWSFRLHRDTQHATPAILISAQPAEL